MQIAQQQKRGIDGHTYMEVVRISYKTAKSEIEVKHVCGEVSEVKSLNKVEV